jgi:hypothetical protein
MKRPVGGVYCRAYKIGLTLGCPEGFSYLSHEAERCGYSTTQLRMILTWGDVEIQRAMSAPGARRTRPTHIVDPTLVDQAVAAWLATETLHVAARARDLGDEHLARILAEFGRDVPARPTQFRAHWRIPTAVVDAAVARWQKAAKATASLTDTARQLGVKRWTLTVALQRAGLTRGKGKAWRVRASDAAAALEARAA